jgi:tetratricopeptide (TPR) repeat protein
MKRALHAIAGCALAAALVVSCSTQPKKTDTVTTMKNQAAQDAATGDGYVRQGRYDLALQFFTLSLGEFTSIDDTAGVIRVYNALGKTYIAMGSPGMAQDILMKARELARGATPGLLFVTTLNLGELYLYKGDAETARTTFEEALAMPADSRTSAQTAILYHDLGTAAKNLGDPDKALEYYGKALEINLAGKLAEQAASDYYMIGSVHSQGGRYDDAIKNVTLALTLDKQIENSHAIAKDLNALGLIATKKGDYSSAFDYYQRAYLVFTTLGLKADMKRSLTGLIAAADALGRPAEAESYRSALADLGTP